MSIYKQALFISHTLYKQYKRKCIQNTVTCEDLKIQFKQSVLADRLLYNMTGMIK